MAARHLDSAAVLDLAQYVRADDLVAWGQGCAEPLSLIGRLLAQRAEIGGFRCFVGLSPSRPVTAEHLDLVRVYSYIGGANRGLYEAGGLDIVPCHYSQLPRLLTEGPLAADVLLLQVPPPDEQGRYSFGLAADYVMSAVATARVVIAEINDAVPWTYGPELRETDIDVVVRSTTPVAEVPTAEADEVERRIAAQVADLIEDGATLQTGIGRLPECVLSALAGHQHLGVHSGVIGDGIVDLVEKGAVTNARKSLDRDRTVAGLLMGSAKLFRHAHRNPELSLRPTNYTHDPEILAGQDRLVAINTALEVDLYGAVNTETAGSRYVGAVGGAVDFARGAGRSRGGMAIVAMPATAGPRSRIVTSLNGPASVPRSDAGVIVTEFGVADLRGQPLRVRRERMLAIAHPEHRELLEKQSSSERTQDL
jgi:acetyl-CoA hydrolase